MRTASSTPTLVFASGVEVSARPSDSIALALRTGSQIVCAEDVLDEAGLAVPDEQEDEVEKFREFLDQISPEDFEEHEDRLNLNLKLRLRHADAGSLTDPRSGPTLVKCLRCNSTVVLLIGSP